MSNEGRVFRVICKDCNYTFYTPDDDVDYCPHCGSTRITKEVTLIGEPYFVIKKVVP